MVIFFSNPSTQKPYNVLLAGFFLLLAMNVNSIEAIISFNLTEFTYDGRLTLQGDAGISAHGGVLTLPTDTSIGFTTSRALYAKPVPLWNSTTGSVASFVTSFSFVVSDIPNRSPADGLVFFIAPLGTNIPPNSTGGAFGILDRKYGFNQFVAVEFDTCKNAWDPSYTHIGIDINSLISLKTEPWKRDSDSLEEVTIDYDSLSKTLRVVVTHQKGGTTTIQQEIDLKAVLPENVNVGFSATTAGGQERHDIYSWYFYSYFEEELELGRSYAMRA